MITQSTKIKDQGILTSKHNASHPAVIPEMRLISTNDHKLPQRSLLSKRICLPSIFPNVKNELQYILISNFDSLAYKL